MKIVLKFLEKFLGKSPLLNGYPEIVYGNPENFRVGHIVYRNMRYGKKILEKKLVIRGVCIIFVVYEKDMYKMRCREVVV